MSQNKVGINNNEVISTKKAITFLASILVTLVALGMAAGYLFFWNQPAFNSAEDYQLESAMTAVKNHPKDSQLRVELGWVLAQAKKYDDAIIEYKNALKIDPKNKSAKLNLAVVYGMKNDNAKAKKELEKLIKESPSFVDARVALGNVYYNTKEYDKALKEFQFALNANPGTVDYILLIAKTNEAKGDKKEAIKNYKRVLEYVPTLETAQEALAKLGVKVDNKQTGGK